jgi:hypothetical protein
MALKLFSQFGLLIGQCSTGDRFIASRHQVNFFYKIVNNEAMLNIAATIDQAPTINSQYIDSDTPTIVSAIIVNKNYTITIPIDS